MPIVKRMKNIAHRGSAIPSPTRRFLRNILEPSNGGKGIMLNDSSPTFSSKTKKGKGPKKPDGGNKKKDKKAKAKARVISRPAAEKNMFSWSGSLCLLVENR